MRPLLSVLVVLMAPAVVSASKVVYTNSPSSVPIGDFDSGDPATCGTGTAPAVCISLPKLTGIPSWQVTAVEIAITVTMNGSVWYENRTANKGYNVFAYIDAHVDWQAPTAALGTADTTSYGYVVASVAAGPFVMTKYDGAVDYQCSGSSGFCSGFTYVMGSSSAKTPFVSDTDQSEIVANYYGLGNFYVSLGSVGSPHPDNTGSTSFLVV